MAPKTPRPPSQDFLSSDDIAKQFHEKPNLGYSSTIKELITLKVFKDSQPVTNFWFLQGFEPEGKFTHHKLVEGDVVLFFMYKEQVDYFYGRVKSLGWRSPIYPLDDNKVAVQVLINDMIGKLLKLSDSFKLDVARRDAIIDQSLKEGKADAISNGKSIETCVIARFESYAGQEQHRRNELYKIQYMLDAELRRQAIFPNEMALTPILESDSCKLEGLYIICNWTRPIAKLVVGGKPMTIPALPGENHCLSTYVDKNMDRIKFFHENRSPFGSRYAFRAKPNERSVSSYLLTDSAIAPKGDCHSSSIDEIVNDQKVTHKCWFLDKNQTTFHYLWNGYRIGAPILNFREYSRIEPWENPRVQSSWYQLLTAQSFDFEHLRYFVKSAKSLLGEIPKRMHLAFRSWIGLIPMGIG